MATTQAIRRLDTPWNTPIAEDRCRHALTGRAPESKLCVHNHECGRCPYDQMLDDIDYRTEDRRVVRAA